MTVDPLTIPTRLRLTKHHGLGNDFLVALEAMNPGLVAEGDLARRLCARHRGIGADGMLFGLGSDTPGTDLRMVLFNADGGEAAISGNGIRCLAQAALRHGGSREGTIAVDTADGVRVLSSTATADPAVDQVRVQMAEVRPGPELSARAAGYAAQRRGTYDIGNPHLVLQVATLDAVDPAVDGPLLEADFDGGINVHFVVVGPGDHLEMVHWERGVGVTEACGSGATVASFAAHAWGLTGPTVAVDMPGGSAQVELGDTPVLTGPATHIADIEVLA